MKWSIAVAPCMQRCYASHITYVMLCFMRNIRGRRLLGKANTFAKMCASFFDWLHDIITRLAQQMCLSYHLDVISAVESPRSSCRADDRCQRTSKMADDLGWSLMTSDEVLGDRRQCHHRRARFSIAYCFMRFDHLGEEKIFKAVLHLVSSSPFPPRRVPCQYNFGHLSLVLLRMHIPTLGDSLIWSLLACNFVVHASPAKFNRRQLPPEANGVKTILTPTGVQIRYKEPGQVGVCETTPGVRSFSGYVDLAPDAHTFFWFFEARHEPAEAPITLWLNGGPGSDSLIGLFQGE